MNHEPILQFTDKAIVHIRKMLAERPNAAFRLSIKKTGCSGYQYVPEIVTEPQENDIAFVADANLQVFIAAQSVSALTGTCVDLADKGLGQKVLVFNNPHAISECGCGESFQLKEEPNE